MRIGLIGEAPHDTNCIKKVLSSLFPDMHFFPLINNIRGSQLDQIQPTKRLLRIEYQLKRPDFVIVIRDLDALINNRSKKRERVTQFNALNSVVDKKGIFLLHVAEIEAMILADIETFGSFYNCAVTDYPDPSGILDPKNELKLLSKKYNETKNLQIFELLDIQKVIDKCMYFNSFIRKFRKTVNIVN